MKPKIVQSDVRGQIVIPKKIREKLNVLDSSAFWIYINDKNEIVLKKIQEPKIKGVSR